MIIDENNVFSNEIVCFENVRIILLWFYNEIYNKIIQEFSFYCLDNASQPTATVFLGNSVI